jgi:radical SAM superfamily enzyme YgiQ (UPF0313 family)
MYRGSYRQPFAHDPAPRRELIPADSFLTRASLIATRGCHNRCDFCYLSTADMHIPYHMREPRQTAEEFAAMDEPYGVFLDNNLGSRPEHLRALCRELAPLNKIWSAAVSLDVADDPSLVREMALAGCTGVFVGLETLSNANIEESRKKSPPVEDYARRVELFHRFGIQVNGSFVLGFDHDGPDVFERTVEWIERTRLMCATFHILTPYPGTPLFERLEREGRILHKNWDLYDTSHAVFQPRHMSPDDLEAGYAWAYQRLFSHRSIWMRRPASWSGVPAYLAMSYLYKKSNWLWPFLIRHRLTARAWRPLIEISRWRHGHQRKRLARIEPERGTSGATAPVSAGV